MAPSPTGKEEITAGDRLAQEAWIGDAVLALYVRAMILSEDGKVDGPKAVRMSSNQFLNTIGEPTKVEAQIGREYEQHGLAAAFGWIEEMLVPVFRRQEENRNRNTSRK